MDWSYNEYLVCLYVAQSSIILLLILFTYEIIKRDDNKSTVLLVIGWTLNLIDILSRIFDAFYPETSIGRYVSDDYLEFIDVLKSYCFLSYGILFFRIRSRKITIGARNKTFLAVLVGFISIYYLQHYYPNNLTKGLFYFSHAAGIFVLMQYYLSHCYVRLSKIIIAVAMSFYIALQFLDFIIPEDQEAIIPIVGWGFSFWIKIFILFGLYMIIQDKIKQSVKVNIYENILSLTLHETTSLLHDSQTELENNVLPQIDRDNKDVDFDRANVTERIERAIQLHKRIASIQNASDTLYNITKSKWDFSDISIDKLIEEYQKEVPSEKSKLVNVNNVIEISYLWRRRKQKSNPNLSKHKLHAQYGGNCHVTFDKYQLFQIVDNIFKNSEEASRKANRNVCDLYVRTKVIKKNRDAIDPEHSDVLKAIESRSYVRVEIEDDGIGTDLLLDEITKFGASEKKRKSKINKGIGMFVIRQNLEANDSYIYFESPAKHSMIEPSKKKNKGSKIILYLARPK